MSPKKPNWEETPALLIVFHLLTTSPCAEKAFTRIAKMRMMRSHYLMAHVLRAAIRTNTQTSLIRGRWWWGQKRNLGKKKKKGMITFLALLYWGFILLHHFIKTFVSYRSQKTLHNKSNKRTEFIICSSIPFTTTAVQGNHCEMFLV